MFSPGVKTTSASDPASVWTPGDKQDHVSCWVRDLIERRGYLRAVVALAARNARLIWTLMMKREDYHAVKI